MGKYLIFSIISLTSFTPVWEAASISITSRDLPSDISVQNEQVEHGSAVGPFIQLTAFATIRAVEVFPTPLGPDNMNAWAILPVEIAFLRVWVI